jgi:uncharacterized pyridoxamine 5'-phosphate oxidase family protein
MSPGDMKAAVEVKEQITHVACTLTRADKPRSQMFKMGLVEEEKLHLCVDLPV